MVLDLKNEVWHFGFFTRRVSPSVYLGKYVEKHKEKIKNENCHETGLCSPEIEKRPPQARGGGGGGLFGLGGPNHNATTQFPGKKICPTYKVYGS